MGNNCFKGEMTSKVLYEDQREQQMEPANYYQ